ncbi:MAG: hypothetical protein JO270_07695, partial [Acidobacteriaceae bacterium]|nr:hypothetical protein [Acidobacteriaceae bacterium]
MTQQAISAEHDLAPAELPPVRPLEHRSADRIEPLLQDGDLASALKEADALGANREAWDRGLAILERLDDVPVIAAWTAAMRTYFPEDARLAAANAWTTTHTDGPEAGMPLWQAGIAQFPNEPEMRRGLAVALGHAGRRDEQDAALAEAIRRLPDSPELHLAWAECAAERGDFGTAAERYERGRSTFPDSPPFYLGVADMLSRLGQHQDAYVLLQVTEQGFPGFPQTAPLTAIVRERAEQAGATLNEEPQDFSALLQSEPASSLLPPASETETSVAEPDPRD